MMMIMVLCVVQKLFDDMIDTFKEEEEEDEDEDDE